MGLQGGVAAAVGELQDLIAGQNELAHEIHELVEPADVHADAGFGRLRRPNRFGCVRLLRRGGRRSGGRRGVFRGRGHGRQQGGVVAVALAAGAADVADQAADRIDQGQQLRDDRGSQLDSAVAQLAEQCFARVTYLFQPREGEETARALDVVEGAENAVQPFAVARVGLQGHQVAVQLLQVLAAFQQEFLDEVFVIHAAPLSCSAPRRALGALLGQGPPFPRSPEVQAAASTAPPLPQHVGQMPWLKRASECSET